MFHSPSLHTIMNRIKRWYRILIPVGISCSALIFLGVHLRLVPDVQLFHLSEASLQIDSVSSLQSPDPIKSETSTLPTGSALSRPTTWQYDPLADAARYGLSYAQCSSAFSDLFKEIERSVAHRRRIGNVRPSDIDLGWKRASVVKAMIYHQKVRYHSSPPHNISDCHRN